MAENKNGGKDVPFFNTEKLNSLLSFYKAPIILASFGFLLLTVAIVLLVKNQTGGGEVIFNQQASLSAQLKIRVDIEGAVNKPGVYEFLDGERVVDALAKAGGLSSNADGQWLTKNINKAARLSDGGKIYIPSLTEVSSGKTQSSNVKSQDSNTLGVTSGKVNVNTATQVELEALPGIGPVTAGKIISARPYQTIEELRLRKIIAQSLYEKLKEFFSI